MTSSATVDAPTIDELVATALVRLEWASKSLDKPLTPTRIHLVRNHIAVARAALLTPPCRPKQETP